MASRNKILYPNAKINLGLIIKGKRSDGYHLLETLLYPVDMYQDELQLIEIEAENPILEIEGMALEGEIADNLCLKAYYALQQAYPSLPSVNIRLIKHIPTGSGLGGGSSDAANTLLGLNDLFDLGVSLEKLAQIGASLGADVPFFLYNRPLLASGIGTDFEEISIELPYKIKIVTPAIHSSTVVAYRALDYKLFNRDRNLKEVLKMPVEKWKDHLVNDLEVPVFNLHPELKQIKEQLYAQGAVYAAMSGSGSAIFGLFPS